MNFFAVMVFMAAAFLLQFFVGSFQMKDFSKTYTRLRQRGRVAIGRSAGYIRSGAVVMFAIDDQGYVLDSAKISGVTAAARFKYFPGFEGKHIETLNEFAPKDKHTKRQFRYTVEDGRLTAVTLSGEVRNSFDWYSLPEHRMAAVLAAFAWAREDAPFWTSEKKRQLVVFDELDWDRGFTLRQGDVTMTLETEMDGFSATTMGIAFPDTKGGENHFAFTFTMALEE